ncbi:hypothetical protein [Chryseobacterium indoltheticum]|uniref:GLPGLI family protein n=1 Tax=Chryseobacterium indoltheticum TaxID=254 RepID=A0A381F555_9FLAO|nr:hypothetical protein [Chryseobacterium indoltheticum]SIR14275.1 hypothetical protein SAMN05421682_11345 [Chryseobacterium indoltheticum]SUX41686.1 Uncharacterised protein [Chryseobacterium indoltheticum]
MMKALVLVFTALSAFVFAQNEKLNDVEFYYGFTDYKSRNLSKSDVYAEIKSQNENYVQISSFRFADTDKKARKENRAWLMKYNDKLYFNMTYAAYIFSYDTFCKVDIIGKKHILLYLDEIKDKKAISYNNTNSGGVLTEVIFNTKPKFSWKDKKGNSYKVLLIDIDKSNNTSDDRDVSFGHIVDTKKILKITNNDPEVISKLKNDQYYLEDIIALVNNENNK